MKKIGFLSMFSLKCLPFSQVRITEQATNKAFLPETVLRAVAGEDFHKFFHFKLQTDNNLMTHCGVQEFTAEDGFIYLPDWLMGNLGLGCEDHVWVSRAYLQRGSFAMFSLHCEVDLGDVDLAQCLENSLIRFACLTLNDTLEIFISGVRTVLVVKRLQPRNAVSIIDLNLNIDFEMAERPFTQRVGIPDKRYQKTYLRFWRCSTRTIENFQPFCGRGHNLSNDTTEMFKTHRAQPSTPGNFPGPGNALTEGPTIEDEDSDQSPKKASRLEKLNKSRRSTSNKK